MNINWYPGHMKKTRELIQRELTMVDLVYEMVDARIPRSSRNPDIDDLLAKKPRIILLNKADLADPQMNQAWIHQYRKEGHASVLVNTHKKQGFKELFSLTDSIMREKRERDAQKGMKNTRTRVMVVGIPNVGKSTLINAIAGKKTAQTGDKPGVTKSKQWIKAEGFIELMDTPGVLWPKLDTEEVAKHLAFTGAITDRILDEETLAWELLKDGIEHKHPGMIERYGDPESMDAAQYMEEIGKSRGFLLRGGVADTEKVGRVVLDEFRGGLWGPITLERP